MKWLKDKKWREMAIGRGIRTLAQSMLSVITTSATFLHDVNWLMVISAGLMGFIVSILTSISIGMPEYGGGANEDK